MSREWLESLKAGDEVLVDGRWQRHLEKVDRVTATQVVIGHSRYRKSDGYRLGDDTWNRVTIRQPTQRDRDSVESARLRAEIEKFLKTPQIPLAVLRAMHECIKDQS